jgi:hypothetical protein
MGAIDRMLLVPGVALGGAVAMQVTRTEPGEPGISPGLPMTAGAIALPVAAMMGLASGTSGPEHGFMAHRAPLMGGALVAGTAIGLIGGAVVGSLRDVGSDRPSFGSSLAVGGLGGLALAGAYSLASLRH